MIKGDLKKLVGVVKLRQNRKAQLILVIFFLIPPLVIFSLVVVLPVATHRFDETSRENSKPTLVAWVKSKLPGIGTRGGVHELLEKRRALQIEDAFGQIRLQLAQDDAISLSVDLIDRVATLEIKGISLRRCKIQGYKMNDTIRHLRAEGQLLDWLNTPFTVQEEWATIPKAPIRIKEAPKDATEADQTPPEEIPVETQDVNFTFQFDRNLTLSVKQVQPSSFSRWLRNTFSDLRQTLRTTWEALLFLLSSKKSEDNDVRIELEFFREDAKAIYRALPQNATMALRL